MIVVTRNGKTTVIAGWLAWLIGAAVFFGTTALLAFIVFLLLGAAITVGAVVLVVVPVAIGVGILASVLRSLKAR